MDYNTMNMSLFINRLLESTEMCPCLLVGKYVNEFKRVFKGHILTVYTLENVRNVIESYSGLREVQGGYLVLEGVGYLSDSGQNSLLKFIEESRVPLILLSYNDRVSPIILSRMKIVVKRWETVKGLKFISPKEAFRNVRDKKDNDKDFREYQEIQYYADNCPSAYSLKMLAGDSYDSITDRILSVLLTI